DRLAFGRHEHRFPLREVFLRVRIALGVHRKLGFGLILGTGQLELIRPQPIPRLLLLPVGGRRRFQLAEFHLGALVAFSIALSLGSEREAGSSGKEHGGEQQGTSMSETHRDSPDGCERGTSSTYHPRSGFRGKPSPTVFAGNGWDWYHGRRNATR